MGTVHRGFLYPKGQETTRQTTSTFGPLWVQRSDVEGHSDQQGKGSSFLFGFSELQDNTVFGFLRPPPSEPTRVRAIGSAL